MCQALGYHRLPVNFSDSSATSTTSDAISDTKSGLFWFAYMLDKGLSLRFGRSSVIQDYDITLPKAMSPQMNISDPWKVVLNLWILQAELTGKVYEQLYSPVSLARPPESRIEAARTLAEDIKILARESDNLNKRMVNEDRHLATTGGGSNKAAENAPVGFYTIDLVLKSDEVWYWSSLALVYRAIPAGPGLSSTLNMECIEASRKATSIHLECMKLTEGSRFTQAAYLHW